MSPRRLWLLLALLVAQRARPGGAGQCQDGELREVWGGGTKCCPRCSWDREDPQPCEAAQDLECKCPPGHGCSDESCVSCAALPPCQPGWEPERIGLMRFQFKCKPCQNGTYSSSRSSWCRNWTDCASSGFITLRAGNSTHNSVCSLPVRALEPAWMPLEFRSSTILAILTAVAVFVLILLTFLLHFCLWSLRREKKFPADLGHSFPRPLPLQGEESHSIQFPEEEHGDKTAEEKLSMLSLKVYSELR
ncbi:tumor necrosis factor receptor superfamily member 18 [Prinia subflava]|uniref:tumor necrosis factor receptor superfamily member 18 n=1 Tax=Prinia subflava TaxID=208062 RepID=UPI002FE1EB41